MGRQQYLERLALGRSAFEDVEEPTSAYDHALQPPVEGYQQQYDGKGRPINPDTEKRNAVMRDAQNTVLELVGVVEKDEKNGPLGQLKYCKLREQREAILEREQDRGEDIELFNNLLHVTLTWWPETLVARVEAGFYASTHSFAQIVMREWRTVQGFGLKCALTAWFPGAPAFLICAVLKTLLCGAVGEGIGRLQEWLNKRIRRRQTLKNTNSLISLACEALVLGIDIALLPLQYYAELQLLGLTPTWPLLPHWRSFLPASEPMSMHALIWKPTVGLSAFKVVSSPAALLLLRNYITREQDAEVPIASELTTFTYPPINASASTIARAGLVKDTLGNVLYQGYHLRVRLMRWFGWHLEEFDPRVRREKRYENNHFPSRLHSATESADDESSTDGEDDRLCHVYRSTALSQRPAHYLAERVDSFFVRLLLLPLNSLIARAITQSIIESAMPLTTAPTTFYPPFGGGPLAHVLYAGGWSEMGSYLSKLGLSMAFLGVTEVAVFGIVFGLTRWQGIRQFSWFKPRDQTWAIIGISHYARSHD